MKEPGVIVIGPAWYSCGSYEVFKRQMKCLNELGIKTYFLAVSPIINFGNKDPYWDYYYSITTDLGADFRGHTARSRLPFKHASFWTDFTVGFWRSVAYSKSLHTRIMSIPVDLKNFIARHDINTVICHHYFNIPLAKKVKKLVPGAQLILETQDVQSLHYQNGKSIHMLTRKTSSFEANLKDEMAIASGADHLIHYNEEETSTFRKHMPGRPHTTIFPAFARNYSANMLPTVPEDVFDFLIVSSGNDPNYKSMVWFLENVWTPELEKARSLRIVGNVDALFALYKNPLIDGHRSKFLGRVDDLTAFYRNARHVLLPVSEGQGISIKTIEALSYGKSLISTPLAFRGFSDHVPVALKEESAKSAEAMRSKMLMADSVGFPQQDERVIELYESLFSVDAQREIYRDLLTRGGSWPRASEVIPV